MFQKFKQKGREEQCEPDDKEKGAAKHVAALLGVDREQMMKAFCKPKIKVRYKFHFWKYVQKYFILNVILCF